MVRHGQYPQNNRMKASYPLKPDVLWLDQCDFIIAATTRLLPTPLVKRRCLAESVANDPIAKVSLEPPAPLDIELFRTVHDTEYIDAVRLGSPRNLASSSSYPWNTNTWTSAIASFGGMADACKAALSDGVSGSRSAGFHHATRERGCMHCVFNGLAIAKEQLRQSPYTTVLQNRRSLDLSLIHI